MARTKRGKAASATATAAADTTNQEPAPPVSADDAELTDEDHPQNGDADDDKPLKEPAPAKDSAGGGDKASDSEGGESDDDTYEVEKILDSKKMKGQLHYLVRWKGYQSDDDSWEPESTLNCPDLIAKYKNKKTAPKADKRKSSSKTKTPPKKKAKSKENGSEKSKKSKPKKKSKDDSDDEEEDDEEKEYEVDRILEVHNKKNGKKEFLIRWKGWGPNGDTWEPEENLNCSEMIKKFLAKVEAVKSVDSRDLRIAPTSTKRFTLMSQDSGRRISRRNVNKQRVRYDDAE